MKIYKLSFLLLFPFLSCNRAPKLPATAPLADSLQNHKTGTVNIVFRSADSGQSWEDIGEGLPENLQKDSIQGNSFFFFANDKGLFLKVGNSSYNSTPTATAPFWTKNFSNQEYNSIVPGKPGLSIYKYWGVNLKTANGTSIWSPVFNNAQEPRIRSVFETAGGTIFIGTNRGFFKTADSGKTWKLVYAGDLAGNLAESDGVLLAICMSKIIRSTDNGENWTVVNRNGGVAWDVKQLKGGFAAITSSSASGTRSLKTSYDGGTTWQPIDAGNKVAGDAIWRTWDDRPGMQRYMTSIIQVGENFFCTHTNGIFKSSDKGKTWELLLPSIKDKVFNLFVSGNVIYAIPSKAGC